MENKVLEKEYIDEQRKLDMMMELERLRSLKNEADREEQHRRASKQHQEDIV